MFRCGGAPGASCRWAGETRGSLNYGNKTGWIKIATDAGQPNLEGSTTVKGKLSTSVRPPVDPLLVSGENRLILSLIADDC